MKNKKIHLSFFGKLIVFIIFFIVLLLIYFIFNRDKIVNFFNSYNDLNSLDVSNETEEDSLSDTNVKNIDLNIYLTDDSESDNSIIKKFFTEGMDYEQYVELLTRKETFLKTTGTYSTIDYDFDKQLHYSEIEDIVENANNSNICNVEILGQSVDGRNIYGIEIGNGKDVLYLDANMHAAEIASTTMLLKFMSELLNSYEDNDTDIVNTLNNVKIALILSVNPDGYEVYNFGVDSLNNKELWWYQNRNSVDFENLKSNANGIDINRNFPSQNGGLYYTNKTLHKSVTFENSTNRYKYYPGSTLGSEPETRASMYFMLKHLKNIYAYADMHSQGRIMYAGKPNLASEFNNITSSFAKSISSITGYKAYGPSSEEVGEGNDGTGTDFMAELACGFKFSKSTGRLSTSSYIDNSSTLVYSFPVLTVETINTYTRDVKVFKNEYYNKGIKKMLYSFIEKYNN